MEWVEKSNRFVRRHMYLAGVFSPHVFYGCFLMSYWLIWISIFPNGFATQTQFTPLNFSNDFMGSAFAFGLPHRLPACPAGWISAAHAQPLRPVQVAQNRSPLLDDHFWIFVRSCLFALNTKRVLITYFRLINNFSYNFCRVFILFSASFHPSLSGGVYSGLFSSLHCQIDFYAFP